MTLKEKARAGWYLGFLLAAFLVATVGSAQPADPPLDLLPVPSTALDFNGFPINPRWRIQTTKPERPVVPSVLCDDRVGDASCTSQRPKEDDAPEQQKLCPSAPKAPRGHVNWFPATYIGQLYWKGWQIPPLLDDDYDLDLSRKRTDGSLDDGGLTQGNKGLLHLEFNAREVIDNFVTTWWVAFRRAASHWWNKPAAEKFVNGREAIVTGLAGLDCVHDCRTELHPVYSLAVNTSTTAGSDAWAVFLQNWGIEGCCCRSQHYLDVKRLVIPLHGRGKKLSGLGPGTRLRGNRKNLKATLYAPDDGGDLYLSVDLQGPEERPRAHGEIELLWETKGTPRRPGPQRKARAAKEVVLDDSPDELWPPELPDAVGFARLKEYVAGLTLSESPAVVEEMDLVTVDEIRTISKRWRNLTSRTKAKTGDNLEVPITVVRGKKPPAASAVPDRPVVDEKWLCREMPLSKLLEEKAE